ncbi:type VII secretion protein EccCb [Nocardioides bruguierae]|uniref:type VII secretion protein EccCb n=1 Tax=Nocardioides bruguierae TaxID=2945102 RepID=UPI0020205567|nr:type VII secretion protein EccCb [Nocardioides bruguierae]MCL8025520.1 type VII secretion protein EccCb [Nocardioides bruguierae]MCL8027407.1 type VII secretion protein EccCb [Nocardioides bruguierae]
MSTTDLRRDRGPATTSADVALLPVPSLPRAESGAAATALVPLVGSLGSVAVMMALSPTGGARALLAGGALLVASLTYGVVALERQRGQRREALRRSRASYLRHLEEVRAALVARGPHPDEAAHPPAELLALRPPRARLVPEGAPLLVRLGATTLAEPALAPPGAEEEADPALARAAERLVAAWSQRPGPALVDLRAHARLTLPAPVARALVCQAAWQLAPASLSVAVHGAPAARRSWSWVPWLPHHVTAPAVAEDDGGEAHRLLVVPAGEAVPTGDGDGRTTVLVVDDDAAPPPEAGRPDVLPRDLAATTARRLARYGGAAPTGGDAALLGLTPLGAGEGADDGAEDRAEDGAEVPAGWAPRPAAERLRVPLGRDLAGEPVLLDLKESALGGSGPHGLVVGATGSGKSELLRSLALALVAGHSPRDLQLVLVDFKGGATFAGIEHLPHVAAHVTNLAGELALVDRMADALAGELTHRQEVLRASGHDSREAYEQARARQDDPTTEPLPSLLVVVDEFSELLGARPEMVETFGAIGRLGRSLGVHLLLASQRLEEGRLRGLEAHLSYRVALRTFTEAESRTVLGVPDAGRLPRRPGEGLLQANAGPPLRFRAAHVSGPAPAAPRQEQGPVDDRVRGLEETPSQAAVTHDGPSLLSTTAQRLARPVPGHERPAHRVWLPPLEEPPTLRDLQPHRTADAWDLPLGLVDLPREQRHDVLRVRLGLGHLAVVGAPRTGRSTALASTVLTLADRLGPDRLHVHLLDPTGALAPLAGLPHVASRLDGQDPTLVRRLLDDLERTIERREQGLDAPADPHGAHTLLVVDDAAALLAAHDDAGARLARLAARGLPAGLHLALGATRWAQLRPGLRELFAERVELRLGDPVESEVDRRTAARVPRHRPGHGTAPGQVAPGRPVGGHALLTAVPDDPARPLGGAEAEVARLTAAAHARWPGRVAPPLRVLPARVDLADLRARHGTPAGTGGAVVLALEEREDEVVALDPVTEPHLLVLGEQGSGRTTVLRSLATSALATSALAASTPGDAPEGGLKVLALDPRRSLLGDLPREHLLDHVSTPDRARAAVADLATYLARRVPGPDVDPARLRARDWWRGAEVLVLVDDHDLLEAGGSPLTPLLPLLPQARDVGLRVAVARRSGGAARALGGPVLATLRDLASPGLLLSADPAEGPLLGSTRPERGVPGRGRLVTRDAGVRTVQVGWSPPGTTAG